MNKNANVVGNYTCDQFYQVRVCTERNEDCAKCLQISCHQLNSLMQLASRSRLCFQLHIFVGLLTAKLLEI